jgi:hypothetical protein
MFSIDPAALWGIAPDGREVAMTDFSLTTEVGPDGTLVLFDSGKEVGGRTNQARERAVVYLPVQ